jgi:hypothetical protein
MLKQLVLWVGLFCGGIKAQVDEPYFESYLKLRADEILEFDNNQQARKVGRQRNVQVRNYSEPLPPGVTYEMLDQNWYNQTQFIFSVDDGDCKQASFMDQGSVYYNSFSPMNATSYSVVTEVAGVPLPQNKV